MIKSGGDARRQLIKKMKSNKKKEKKNVLRKTLKNENTRVIYKMFNGL